MSSNPPDDSIEVPNLDAEGIVADPDLLIVGDDSDATQFKLKKVTAAALKTYILDQTGNIPIFSAINSNAFTVTGTTFYPISGSVQSGQLNEKTVLATAPINGTYRNFTIDVTANQAGTSIGNKVEFRKNENTVLDTILIPTGSGTPVITSPTVINVTKEDRLSYKIFIDGADASKITIGAISITTDVLVGGGVVPVEFTWAASDEDSTLLTGIQYVTEAALLTKTLSEVKLSLKNAPTGSILQVDVQKETGANTNTFATIFSTLPQIDTNQFFNTNDTVTPVFSDSTWEIDRRLRISITLADSNDAATGLKVTLA